MCDIERVNKLCNRMPGLFPGVETAWYSQGFIGVKLSQNSNAHYVKIDGVPDNEIIPTITNEMSLILRKEDRNE